MIRFSRPLRLAFFVLAAAFAGGAILATSAPAQAQEKSKPKDKKTDSKPKDAKGKDAKGKDSKTKDPKGKDAKGKDAKTPAAGGAGKPAQVGTFGDWGAFQIAGKSKTCYALAKPKERAPAALKRDDAFVFISNRPGENVRNELSIIMGFAMKDGGDARADISGTTFDLISKGTNAWVKNPAEESQFIDAMKKGSKLVIKAPSIKGNVTTDTYSLSGLSQALDRVQKDCP